MKTGAAHLSYCLNVHPARDADDVRDNITRYAMAVKRAVCPERPFGLGLWLPAEAASAVRDEVGRWREWLHELGCYVFTLNGFPYGCFHGEAIKRRVYVPDWSRPERRRYTEDLAHILAGLLPEGVPGSISTVPVAYGKAIPSGAVEQLAAAADALAAIRADTGRQLWLALEPEPDCCLENSADTIAFFDHIRAASPHVADHLGLCFDTCHFAVQGEDPADAWTAIHAAGIPIPKVQLSAALACDNRDGAAAETALRPYREPVYLHQTRVFGDDAPAEGLRYPDLGPALDANPRGRWLIHFHVPLPFRGYGPLGSTADLLTPQFLAAIFEHCPNIEVETYTFDVLPENKNSRPVDVSVADELRWVLQRLDEGARAVP